MCNPRYEQGRKTKCPDGSEIWHCQILYFTFRQTVTP